jgi:L-lactate permease
MKKIYNKKGFCSGIISLLLAAVVIIFVIPDNYHDPDYIRMVKSIIIAFVLLIIGITSVYKSLSYQYTKEDKQNDDEREKLVSLKAANTAFKITIGFCCAAMILLMIAFGMTRYEGFASIFIGFGLVFSISTISQVCAYFYHDKRI